MLLSVVVPLLNEAESILLMLSRFRDPLQSVLWNDAIVVDDGSSDDTWSILELAAISDRHVKLLRFSRNVGH
jgi:polyisoprenyl-phosphate glycosyltransferase